MHELAIAQSIVDVVFEELKRHGGARVTAVGVRIGALSDVLPEALEFGFEMIARDSALEGARLVIERVDARGCCSSCGIAFNVAHLLFQCPVCQCRDVTLTAGQEMQIAYIELDDGQPDDDGGVAGIVEKEE